MAVIESKGNGYALFNGVKLPSLPEWDKETYPYIIIVVNTAGQYRIRVTEHPFKFDLEYSRLLMPVDSLAMNTGVIGQSATEWGIWTGNSSIEAGKSLSGIANIPFWANYDILNTTDDSVHLAATEPIALDGMNVIEWDGNTEGLEKFGTSPFYRVSSVTDVDVSKNVCALRKTGSGIITINTSLNESSNYYGIAVVRYVSNASETYPYEGVYLAKSGETVMCPLFAYYPIEQEPADDMSKGKLFLLSRMFSKPIFHAMTGKWFWYE